MMSGPLAAGRKPKRSLSVDEPCNISRTSSSTDVLIPTLPSPVLQQSHHHVAAAIVATAFVALQLRLPHDRCPLERIAAMSDSETLQHPR